MVREYQRLLQAEGQHPNDAISQASERVLARTLSTIMIPKRFSLPMREIWALQPRLEQTRGGRAKRLLTHPRFRAAYDFLLLRAACGEVPQALADGWTQAQTGELAAPEPDDAADGDEGVAPPARRKRRRRGGRRRRPGAPAPTPAQ